MTCCTSYCLVTVSGILGMYIVLYCIVLYCIVSYRIVSYRIAFCGTYYLKTRKSRLDILHSVSTFFSTWQTCTFTL